MLFAEDDSPAPCLAGVSFVAGVLSLGVTSVALVLATSSAFLMALACISFCLAGSLAMIETRSVGTGVESLKLLANFFNSVSLTSLSALALLLRAFWAFSRCWLANDLKELRTSLSTVDVALGVPSLTCGERLRLVDDEFGVGSSALVLSAGLLSADTAVVKGASVLLITLAFADAGSGVPDFGRAPFLLEFPTERPFASSLFCIACFLAGALIWDEMIAGSIGAPLTVE